MKSARNFNCNYLGHVIDRELIKLNRHGFTKISWMPGVLTEPHMAAISDTSVYPRFRPRRVFRAWWKPTVRNAYPQDESWPCHMILVFASPDTKDIYIIPPPAWYAGCFSDVKMVIQWSETSTFESDRHVQLNLSPFKSAHRRWCDTKSLNDWLCRYVFPCAEVPVSTCFPYGGGHDLGIFSHAHSSP